MQKYIDILNGYCLSNSKINGLFYGGSIGRNDSDQFSDIDARIIVKSTKEIPEIKERIFNLFDNIMFLEENNSIFMVIHLKNLMKLDIFFYTREQLTPSIWLKNILIIKDDENIIQNIKDKSKIMSVSPTKQQIKYISNKYLACLIEIHKRAIRNEIYYLEQMINQMTNILCYLWYLEKEIQPNALGDWSKYQGERSNLNIQELKFLSSLFNEVDINRKIDLLNEKFIKVMNEIKVKYDISIVDSIIENIEIIRNIRMNIKYDKSEDSL
nr:aminoglycoside 6-adenylyltransferase [Mammaliicoccus sp. Marseille-Q6498]